MATDVNRDLVLRTTPVPDTTGLFFHGPTMAAGGSSLGDGLRCVGGMTSRMFPFVGRDMTAPIPGTAALAIDYAAPHASGLTGQRSFQYWFRSGVATGTGSNTSDGYTITF